MSTEVLADDHRLALLSLVGLPEGKRSQEHFHTLSRFLAKLLQNSSRKTASDLTLFRYFTVRGKIPELLWESFLQEVPGKVVALIVEYLSDAQTVHACAEEARKRGAMMVFVFTIDLRLASDLLLRNTDQPVIRCIFTSHPLQVPTAA